MANKKKTMKKTMKNVMKNGMNSMKNVMKSGMKSVKNVTKKPKKGKRALTPWNLLVQEVYAREKKNGKSFKECLVIAAQEKKKGKMH